jgi:hypothetical protein
MDFTHSVTPSSTPSLPPSLAHSLAHSLSPSLPPSPTHHNSIKEHEGCPRVAHSLQIILRSLRYVRVVELVVHCDACSSFKRREEKKMEAHIRWYNTQCQHIITTDIYW